MKFSASKNLSDQIADYLEDRIVNLEIIPGERILEQKLAKELGVSRSPVREAFRILEQTGLVELIPRCGAHVTAVTKQNIEAYFDMFTLVLCHVVRRCIENYTNEQLKAMSSYYYELKEYAEKGDKIKFYEIILKCVKIGTVAAANLPLEQVVKSITPYLKRLQFIAIALKPESLDDNFRYFKLVLESLYEKDVDKGSRAIEDYLDHEKKIILDAIKDDKMVPFIETLKKLAES
ncbi:MAG: GntR family transcriptional regulator [Proteobacteria bacterium]|nr:GntR family transcriptional regulator [Pseudomonadota bacterium]